MNNDLLRLLQSASIDQLKVEIDKIKFVGKELQDFQNGKNAIDEFAKLTNVDINVQNALILYAIYKLKGGN